MFALLLAATIGVLACAGAARATGDVFVLQDETPIVSRPGVGGKVLAWVDTGFPLTVRGIQGDWLRVSSSLLTLPADSLWVPAARVGDALPGTFEIAYPVAGIASPSARAGFRLEILGTEALRVRVTCRMVDRAAKDFVEIIDDVPVVFDLDGTAVDCTVRKLSVAGRIDAVLLAPGDQVVATASTFARRGKIRLRSQGPWGPAAGFALPTRYIVLTQVPDFDPLPDLAIAPLGNPVPPFGQSPVPPP